MWCPGNQQPGSTSPGKKQQETTLVAKVRKQLEDTLAAGMKRSLEESDESDSQDDEDEDEESYSDVDDDDDDDDVEIPPAKKQKPTPGGWFLTFFLQPRSAQCFAFSALIAFCLQCFDAVGWAARRASGL